MLRAIFGAVSLNGKPSGRIDEFPPGRTRHAGPAADSREIVRASTARSIPLLAAFDRIVAGGRPELVLVSGYSGIGKSAVVNELHKPLVPPRGLFASGKFDQYKRDIPYATLAQAFQSLIRPLLSKSEEELQQMARCPSRGARSERTAHCGSRPGIEAHHRRTAASS